MNSLRSSTPDVDTVVVGSGPNGLVAAVRLAAAGHRVLVLEAQAQVGGGLRTEALTLPGFRHDICSSVHPLAAASPAFRNLGLHAEGLRFAHPGIPLAHPLDGPNTAFLHRSVQETAAGLGRDGRAWIQIVGGVARAGPPLVDAIMSPLSIPRAPIRLGLYGAVGLWPATRLGQIAFREERARALFAGLAAHSVLSLRAVGTSAYGMLLGGLGHGVGWPVAVGGSQSIADALVARLQSLGGEIRVGHPVTSLSQLPSARNVVLDLGPRQVVDIAGDALPHNYAAKLCNYRYGNGVFKVDWALDGPVPWRDERIAAAGTVHLGGSAADIASSESAMSSGRHSDRPYVLFVQPTVADPTRAPAGKHVAWGYCHVPNGSRIDMTERIEDAVERAAPGFRERIIGRHSMDSAALEHHNANLVGGDISGGASDWAQILTRPTVSRTPWVTPVEGLYLCSASTPPGGGVHGMSGWNAAGHVLRRG